MVLIGKKEECVACEACVQICPQECISFDKDREGFYYPKVEQKKCIDCGLCEKACPVLNQNEERKPINAFAAKNIDESIRLESSSGGIFTLLSEFIIEAGGIVFGAKFSADWDVIHGYTEMLSELSEYRGSKYVQSRIGETYKQAKWFLDSGRWVLFSGTPCQIAGLKLFLRQEYKKLITVDIICHGTPSPKVWLKYRQELLRQIALKSTISDELSLAFTKINFRDKADGWKKFSFTAEVRFDNEKKKNFRETLEKNIFLKGFLCDLYLRPSCHSCPTKSLKSGSDITIADFWGIQRLYPDFDDDKGVSLVFINTLLGKNIYKRLALTSIPVDFNDAILANSALNNSSIKHKKRDEFMKNIDRVPIIELINEMSKLSFISRMNGVKNRFSSKFHLIKEKYICKKRK